MDKPIVIALIAMAFLVTGFSLGHAEARVHCGQQLEDISE